MKLPPQIPGSPEEFTRVIVLLGNRSKADLRQQQRKELIALLGAYPNQETAAQWKHSLKQLANSDSK